MLSDSYCGRRCTQVQPPTINSSSIAAPVRAVMGRDVRQSKVLVSESGDFAERTQGYDA